MRGFSPQVTEVHVPVQMLPPQTGLPWSPSKLATPVTSLAPHPELIFADTKQIHSAVLLIKKHSKKRKKKKNTATWLCLFISIFPEFNNVSQPGNY